MLIILEGPDCAGKSTLAREIVARIGLHATVDVLHAGPPTAHPLTEYLDPLVRYRPDKRHVVCDRWHLGEAVYPRVLGRDTRWNVAVERYMHLFLRSRGACVVLLAPNDDELALRFNLRGDGTITLEQLFEASAGYDVLHRRHFDLRFPGGVAADVAASPGRIIKTARQLHLQAFFLNDFVTYVGGTRPRVLLLGDRRAQDSSRDNVMPAFVPCPATSGHFLLTHLDVIRLDVGIANACDVDDPVALYKTLHQPLVVALGRNAARRLDELGVPHGSVPHPQYVRRFHHGRGDEYALAIETAAYTGRDLSSWFQ